MSQIQQLSQSTKKIEQTQKIAAEIDQKEKSQAEAKAKAEAEKKEATEKAAQLEKEKKEAERASAEKKQREQAEAEAQKKQAAEEEREKKEAKHQQLVQAKKQQREAAHVKQEDKLQKELEQFSVTLNDKHYTNAVQIMDQIKESGYPEPKFTVNTSEIFKGQFTFPQIAHNDFAVEQLEELSIHEENLKKDPENEKMKEEFVQSAEDIAGKLKERYGEQWVNPRDQE